jgi:hypothetical protein
MIRLPAALELSHEFRHRGVFHVFEAEPVWFESAMLALKCGSGWHGKQGAGGSLELTVRTGI